MTGVTTALGMGCLLLAAIPCRSYAAPYGDAGLPAAHTSQPDGKILRISFPADNPLLTGLDPFQAFWTEHRAVLRSVVESLTSQDPKTGQIRPGLAESWTVAPDGLSYVFRLRPGVTFSNGAPFDAASVKTALDSDKAEAQELPTAFGATYLAGFDHAEIIDPNTIKIALSHPNGGFLQALSTTALGILAPQSYSISVKARAAGALIGTGPFTLQSYTPEVGIILKKRKGYSWAPPFVSNRGDALVDTVDVRFVPEQTVRNGEFLQGDVDVVWPRSPFSDPELRQLADAHIYSRSLPGPALNLYPNTTPGHFLADPLIRRAVQKAIDRESYAHTVYSEKFPSVQGFLDVSTPFFRSERDKLTYDLPEAKRLLDQAGWIMGHDGYRYKDNKRLTLTLLLPAAAGTGDDLIQDQLRQAGIDLQLSVGTAGQWLTWLAQGKYDLASIYLTGGDPVILQVFLDPRRTGKDSMAARIYPAEILPKVTKLFDNGVLTTDTAERAQAYGAFQDLIIDENLSFPLAERLWQTALSPKIEGFSWSGEASLLLVDVDVKP